MLTPVVSINSCPVAQAPIWLQNSKHHPVSTDMTVKSSFSKSLAEFCYLRQYIDTADTVDLELRALPL